MAATKIMIIRHAEKPDDPAGIGGVAPNGAADAEELTVRGWQRAGALIGLFAPPSARFADPHLALPCVIFASGTGHHSKSLRPQHTVTPLAEKIGSKVNVTHLKGDEKALVTDAIATNGVVLIAWEHEAIPTIANLIIGNQTTCPQSWPGQ